MISIFVMYSTDRQLALEATISCLEDMPLYQECQKTLVVDRHTNIHPPGWFVVEVPRLNGFSWANMWDAGVNTARYPNILYLDSDRLWPKNFLELIAQNLEDGKFVFTIHHFLMLKDLPIAECKRFLSSYEGNRSILTEPPFLGTLRFDARHLNPVHGPGKNVMSGGTAFTKSTYYALGGIDPWYRGHGAYADTDFHMAAHVAGCRFVDLQLPELHLPHQKFSDDQKPLEEMQLRRLALDNFIYYCWKWGLPSALAESLSHESGIKRPDRYVKKRMEELGQSPGNSVK